VLQQNAAPALQLGEEYVRDTKALLLRANLLKHDFVQRPPRGGGGGGGVVMGGGGQPQILDPMHL
jgi:hypothetical protein